MYPIIALVGPSGGGKTTLMDRAVAALPEKVARIVSFTTRPKRNGDDELYYEFVTPEEVQRRKDAGIIVQYVEFAGNAYGTDRPHIEGVLKEKFGMLAVVEQGIETFKNAGFAVKVVKIIPKGYTPRVDRIAADKARETYPIAIDKTIVNDFSPGGLEKAAAELKAFIVGCENFTP